MLVLIDNYDSFTYNIYQYLCLLGAKTKVIRNDQTNIKTLERQVNKIDGFIISPGPGRPEEAGISVELIRTFAKRKPILGICLGHQAIAHAFGGKIIPAPRLMHGKTDHIDHISKGLYKGIENPMLVTRYHSLVVERNSLPSCLVVTAKASDGSIMGLKHRSLPVEGVQFHPESYMCEKGPLLLQRFIQRTERRKWT
jgi:anthranilate synthase/aminodeoxychorismate synthase-like glutamine amidotransferase